MTLAAPVAKPLPKEEVTPIKPSEAIRLGILKAPIQSFGDYSSGLNSACALGAMRLGYGGSISEYPVKPSDKAPNTGFAVSTPDAAAKVEEMLANRWTGVVCHLCGSEELYGWPPHLNDFHEWSRERIADFLEAEGL